MLKKLFALLLCVVITLGVGNSLLAELSGFAISAAGTSINEDKQRLAELQAKLKAIKNNISTLDQSRENIDTQTQTMLQEKLLLEQEYSLLNDQINTISAIITEYDSILDKTAEEKLAKEQELGVQLDEFGVLLVELYKNKDYSKFDIFLKSDSYASYVAYVEYMEHILKSSDTMIQQINENITAIGEREKEYEEASLKLTEKEKELKASQKELDSKNEELDRLLGENRDKLEFTEEEKAQMKVEEQNLLAEISKLQQQIQDKVSATYNGQFSWPFASNVDYRITSRFGSRTNPFNGGYEHHNGLDIVCARGTAIRAVDAGVVTYAGHRGAFGNVVFIEHGGGITTIYAHCDSLLVSAGAKVLKDQVIARVGDTGQVTGVHLHFAVSKNGSYVNPEDYLPTYFTKGY